MIEDYKVDPLSIKVDQTKRDTRRDAWDRDYMGSHYRKPEPKSTKLLSKASSVNLFSQKYVKFLHTTFKSSIM